jgi:hypothetical protein
LKLIHHEKAWTRTCLSVRISDNHHPAAIRGA